MSESFRAHYLEGGMDKPSNVSSWSLEKIDRFDIPSMVSPEETQELFGRAINVMEGTAERYGFKIPAGIHSRVSIVDEYVYSLLLDKYPAIGESPAATLPAKQVVISLDRVSRLGEKIGSNLEDLLVQAGTHELWHTLEYEELWIRPSDPVSQIRRLGLVTQRPSYIEDEYDDETRDCWSKLLEGFTEYLTQKTLREAGLAVYEDMRTDEQNLVKKIMEETGEEVFFKANYSKKGFRDFYLALNSAYPRPFYVLPKLMTYDEGMSFLELMDGRERKPYQDTHLYLNGNSAVVPTLQRIFPQN